MKFDIKVKSLKLELNNAGHFWSSWVLVITTDKFTLDYLKMKLMKNPIPDAYPLTGLLEIIIKPIQLQIGIGAWGRALKFLEDI